MPKFHVVAGSDFKDSIFKDKKMVEEFQKYKDILKREQDEFRKQLVREVRISRFLLLQ